MMDYIHRQLSLSFVNYFVLLNELNFIKIVFFGIVWKRLETSFVLVSFKSVFWKKEKRFIYF